MRMTDELDQLVLRAVGDDFVTLDFIVGKLSSAGSCLSGKPGPELLYRRLLDLITDKLIRAYLLHADPPYITPVKTTSTSLPNSWFYITQRGRKCLANSSRQGATLAAEEAAAPDEDQFTSVVNF